LGGGSDLPNHYRKNGGYFVSASINRYIYCTLKDHSSSFIEKYRLNYSESELKNEIEEIENDIIRETFKKFLLPKYRNLRLYLGTIGDIRSNSGLGSSSAFTCALILGINQFINDNVLTPTQIAQEACKIELEDLKKEIGIQDQYASALGNIRKNEILKNGTVISEVINIGPESTKSINSCLLLVDTQITRNAETISSRYANPDKKQEIEILKLQNLAIEFGRELPDIEPRNIPNFIASALNQSMEVKAKFDRSVIPRNIQEQYQFLIQSGCLGGKLLGAGGGGYFLMIADPRRIEAVREVIENSGFLVDQPKISDTGVEKLLTC
jgi:D-glycero-alpha-D-manno-heptose-7-phosphate kinase